MKNLKLVPLLLLFAVLGACRKYDNDYRFSNNDDNRVQPGSAANMVGSSLASDADGIVSLVADVSLNAQGMVNAHSSCGTIRSDSTTRQSQPGSTTSYTYTNVNKLTVLCNSSNQPDSALNTSKYNGSFGNTSMTSTNSGSSAFTINGLLQNVNNYTVNGEYKRNGNYQSTTANSKVTSNTINIILKNLLVSKRYHVITGGTATFTITGTSTANGTATASGNYNYTGTLTFDDSNYALLTLNSVNYKVNLTTGAVIKQ